LVLGGQGLSGGVGADHVDIDDVGHELARRGVQPGGGAEIRTHTVAPRGRVGAVTNVPTRDLHEVGAGVDGDAADARGGARGGGVVADHVEIDDVGHELARFGVHPAGGLEIRTHTVTQRGRFADVNNVPTRVFHEVDAGLDGEAAEARGEVRAGDFHHLSIRGG